MPVIEVRADVGGSDGIPHAFIVVTHPDGTQSGHGFAPAESLTLLGDGKIYNDLDHEYTNSSGEIHISDSQYASLMTYINESASNPPPYDIASGIQCATWLVNGLRIAEVAPPWASPQGLIIWDSLIFNPYWQALGFAIADAANRLFQSGTTWQPPRDPLAIDLDGDGLETAGIGTNPILFDHDANGIKTGTGWLQGDDAWLVRDLDGNGSIDSGRELFGVDSVITDATGVTRNARTGFEALAALDSNRDGVFSAADAAFGEVKLWRDLNQDGVSQANELGTLAQHGIQSIGLVSDGSSTNLGNGNTINGSATVRFTNGATTDVDAVKVVDGGAGNLDLADNPFYREFTDQVPISDAAEALPDMGGSGVLREWRSERPSNSPLHQTLAGLGVVMGTSGSQSGAAKGDIFLGSSAANSFSAGAGNHVLDGAASGTPRAIQAHSPRPWCWPQHRSTSTASSYR